MGEATATGWSKEFPTVDGDYFTRDHANDTWYIPIRISEGEVFEFGHEADFRKEYRDCEFLGPFTAADFEQLIRLREAAEAARRYLVGVVMTETGHNANRAREIANQITLAQREQGEKL